MTDAIWSMFSVNYSIQSTEYLEKAPPLDGSRIPKSYKSENAYSPPIEKNECELAVNVANALAEPVSTLSGDELTVGKQVLLLGKDMIEFQELDSQQNVAK